MQDNNETAIAYISDIVEKLKMISDNWRYFFNIKTGEYATIPDENYALISPQDKEIILNNPYLYKEITFDINQKISVMQEFCHKLLKTNREKALILLDTFNISENSSPIPYSGNFHIANLESKHLMQEFMKMVEKLDLTDQYNKYFHNRCVTIAHKWCEENSIYYEERKYEEVVL